MILASSSQAPEALRIFVANAGLELGRGRRNLPVPIFYWRFKWALLLEGGGAMLS